MRRFLYSLTIMIVAAIFFASCMNDVSPNTGMINLLASVEKKVYSSKNTFCPEAKLEFYDSLLKVVTGENDRNGAEYSMANTYLELGNEQQSVDILEVLLRRVLTPGHDLEEQKIVMKALGMAYLRLGERTNCIYDHSNQSCILPIAGRGVHKNKTGSQKAIELFTLLVEHDATDHESQWLLNIAYMTIGGYPQQVPAALLIKGLDADNASVKPFTDVAMNLGLNTRNMAGGSIVDDFDNDGYPDIISSSWGLKEGMHYYRNNANGTFTDLSGSSGLALLTGGLNIVQTDYNNDGWKDIFVLRGAWKGAYGNEPNSLLKNNGDGTFTDVTKETGLLSFHPTQTATWADFNNDGWLDVFIGNESTPANENNPCELYIGNKHGKFTNIAAAAGCNIIDFVKGVTSGDYNNDGWTDIFISTLTGQKVLLRNDGLVNGNIHFSNVTQAAGIAGNTARTFPTWFWDYDNDGWLDILVCGYEFNRSLAWYVAEEALGLPAGNSGKVFLFRNKQDGSFEDVSEKVSLNKVAFAMGANFGDIDNDGWLDIYLGTGNPLYQSIIPNKMFKNTGGNSFTDITIPARVGNIQKGHGVSFADLDSDGDEDIYIDMGGAYIGDAYPNSLFLNPGQNDNRWINLILEGTVCNKAAIGARIKVTFDDGGKSRSVYRLLSSGGSFGSNPLAQHIGIGKATEIQSIEIKWPGSNAIQVVSNVPAGYDIKVKQNEKAFTTMLRNKADFTVVPEKGTIPCLPQ